MDEWDVDESEPELDESETATITALLAEIDDDDRHRIEPPPSIWNAIVDTVTADRNGPSGRALNPTRNGNGSKAAEVSAIEDLATATISLAVRRGSSPPSGIPTEAGGWRRQWLPVAAAVAITIVGGLVTWAFSGEIGGDNISNDAVATGPTTFGGEVVAAAELANDGLPVPTTESAEARLVRAAGRFYVELEVPELPSVDGYYELWIFDSDAVGMFSLGVITGDGRFALPDNLDPGEYPVIDVSVEPTDGDPTHAGQSMWRGVLDI